MADRARGRGRLGASPLTAADTFSPILREHAPRVLGALLRRYGGLDSCEEAVQEALLAAVKSWPDDGVPDNPFGWLYAVGSRRVVDMARSDTASSLRSCHRRGHPLRRYDLHHNDVGSTLAGA